MYFLNNLNVEVLIRLEVFMASFVNNVRLCLVGRGQVRFKFTLALHSLHLARKNLSNNCFAIVQIPAVFKCTYESHDL